uniref:Uncharacterized protein n=1 Tax=Setaria digitata TaxID=48799 RepID=A0A915PNB9_9BILA
MVTDREIPDIPGKGKTRENHIALLTYSQQAEPGKIRTEFGRYG